MKTTLNLDDHLLWLARKSAVERGVTLTQVVEEALAAAVVQPAKSKRYRLRWTPVKGHRPPDVDVADRSALYDRMEGRP